jgi:UPF0755 protein
MRKWLFLIPLVIVLGLGTWLARELYTPYRGYQGHLVLVIPPGARAPRVANLLLQSGILNHRFPFLFRYWVGRWHHKTLKFGEYLFDRPLSASQVYWKLVRGEVYLHAVVIPEGSDRFDMARILQREIGLNPSQFLEATSDAAPIRDLDPEANSLEGYLFPDTYRLPRGVSASRVVETMLARFRQEFNTHIRQDLPSPSGNLHQIITLASLVEKETPNPEERPMIASVFLRRLQKGMLLQCDPTVIFAVRLSQTTGLSDPFNGPITQSDLLNPSPYNTYVHAGLPPGPICSPGMASIEAALHPASGSALYFVSNHHGGHYFADTLAEHNRNVARSRKETQSTEHNARPSAQHMTQ